MSTSPLQDHAFAQRTPSFAPICQTCVHTIPSCHDMSLSQKSSVWYSDSEINFFKNAAKFVGTVFRSTKRVNENDIDKVFKLQSSRSLKNNLFLKFLMSYYPNMNRNCAKTDALHYCPRGIESRIFPDRKANKETAIHATLRHYSQITNSASADLKYVETSLKCSKRATDIALASAAVDEFYASSSQGISDQLNNLDACMSLLVLTPLSQRPNSPIKTQFRILQKNIDWRVHQLSARGKDKKSEDKKRKLLYAKDRLRTVRTNDLVLPRTMDAELLSVQ